jgi:hypothetical protein
MHVVAAATNGQVRNTVCIQIAQGGNRRAKVYMGVVAARRTRKWSCYNL